MNWVAVSAIAEVFGVIAVIISLIYLATQIRQSNQAAQAAATDQITGRFIHWMNEAFGDENIKTYFAGGLQSMKGCTVSEGMEFFGKIQNLFRIMEEIYFHRQKGFIDDDIWIGWESWLANMKSYDVVQFFYSQKRKNFSPNFQQYWEELPESTEIGLVALVKNFLLENPTES